jgi:hypothetical protein
MSFDKTLGKFTLKTSSCVSKKPCHGTQQQYKNIRILCNTGVSLILPNIYNLLFSTRMLTHLIVTWILKGSFHRNIYFFDFCIKLKRKENLPYSEPFLSQVSFFRSLRNFFFFFFMICWAKIEYFTGWYTKISQLHFSLSVVSGTLK